MPSYPEIAVATAGTSVWMLCHGPKYWKGSLNFYTLYWLAKERYDLDLFKGLLIIAFCVRIV